MPNGTLSIKMVNKTTANGKSKKKVEFGKKQAPYANKT